MKLLDVLKEKSPGVYFRLLNVRSQLSRVTRGNLVRAYLESTPRPKLQLGSGRNYLEGWLNTDFLAKHPRFIFLNVCQPFPLPSDTFERIYSEHMIEHIPMADCEKMLAECFRILKPGGRLRLETPDMQKVCNLYAARGTKDAQGYIEWQHENFGDKKYPPTVCFAINNIMRNWDHVFLYDSEMLEMALVKAGFSEIKQYGWNQSDDPEFQNISQRAAAGSTEYETLAMEGTKAA